MPVLDHEVHPLTRQSADARYGCNSDKPRAKSYWAPNRTFFPDGSFEVRAVRVPDVASSHCRNFYMWDADPRCTDCPREKDREYAQTMRNAT